MLEILLLNAAILAGCGGGSSDEATGSAPEPLESGARIVSLSPALTQVLIDLGQADSIVGRTRYAPPGLESVPIVGDLLDPDLERINAVSPNLLLVQPAAGGVDPDLIRYAQERGWLIASWHIDRLVDVERVVAEVPDVLARVNGDVRHARSAGSVWLSRLHVELRPSQGVKEAGRVLLLYAVDPPAAFGRETYIDDVLVALGGRNAINRRGYPVLSLEDVLALSPDAILVLSPDLGSAVEQCDSLRARLGANAEGMRIVPLEGRDLLIPGTRLLEGIETLKSAFPEQDR